MIFFQNHVFFHKNILIFVPTFLTNEKQKMLHLVKQFAATHKSYCDTPVMFWKHGKFWSLFNSKFRISEPFITETITKTKSR